MREDYPFPLGRAFPATQEFLRPRAERLAPGGIYSLITDDQDFATTLQAAADMRGDLEVTRYAPPAAHEGTPQSPWLRSRTRDILIFRKR